MAFRLATGPAAGQARTWVAALALGAAVLALLAAAAGLWTLGGGRGGGRGLVLRGGSAWASGLFSSSQVLPGQQAADVVSAGHPTAESQQQTAAGNGTSAPALPPLCGGASSVRRVADSLAASGQALMEGLEADFKPYEQGFGLEEVEATAAFLQADGELGHVHTWIEVHNQTVTYPRRKNRECSENCDSWFYLLKDSLERGMRTGRLSIPEGVPFLFNVNDASWCPVEGDGSSKCTAPLFSIFKSKYDRDIPIPNFKPVFEPIFHPWESKKEVAFFRGAPICSWPPLNGSHSSNVKVNCSRWVVAQLSWDYPEMFNATLTDNVTQYGGPRHVDMPRVSHQEAAEYKYVLAVDGATAAYRLAFLMATNSVVLKQVTDKMEWYYRAIHPCEHYLPFWVHNQTDVLQLVQQLQRNPANDLIAQHIAANSQAFALAYLSDEYAYWYWQLAIDKYVALYRGPRSGSGSSGGSSSSSGPPDGGGSTSSTSSGGGGGGSSGGPADAGTGALPPGPSDAG